MLTDQFIAHVKKNALFPSEARLLLAVSGGLDSVVLAELCRQAGFSFSIAHCNFRLRGDESERDENFVRQLAEKYNVPLYLRQFDTSVYAEEKKLSIQEAARELRYDFFSEILHKETDPLDFLLTAHHQDDNIETVLMNFFRGTGLQGLTGIPTVNGKIRRPLLPFSRTALTEFARENGLQWVEDSSNQQSKYTRNFLRNECIPSLERIYPELKNNLAKNMERFREINKFYLLSVSDWRKKLLHKRGKEWHIPVALLLKANKALQYELLAEFGFSEGQLDEIWKLAGAGSGKYMDAANSPKRIIVNRKWFIIADRSGRNDNSHFILPDEKSEVEFPSGSLKAEIRKGAVISEEDHIASIDANSIQFPLLLRKPRTGDYFYPLGMKKKKKIARFFIDKKLSKTEKEQAWVLESAGKVIWVLGHRLDDRVKLKNYSSHTLRISWSRTE